MQLRRPINHLMSEEDKCATCKMVWSFSFKKDLNFKKSPGGKILKMCEKEWKSAKKCEVFVSQLRYLEFTREGGVETF